jgi:hypothetical protein
MVTWIKDMKDKKDSKKFSVAMMTVMLLHIVGDIHQPLHAGIFFSKAFEKGDQGGNKYMVKVDGKEEKIHAFFDNLVGKIDPIKRVRLIYIAYCRR